MKLLRKAPLRIFTIHTYSSKQSLRSLPNLLFIIFVAFLLSWRTYHIMLRNQYKKLPSCTRLLSCTQTNALLHRSKSMFIDLNFVHIFHDKAPFPEVNISTQKLLLLKVIMQQLQLQTTILSVIVQNYRKIYLGTAISNSLWGSKWEYEMLPISTRSISY